MKVFEERQAIIVLEDGKVFHGKAAGKIGTVTGEICFNTGMTGYQEVFTDPSYFGQLMVTTNAHIGNYGIMTSENQSDHIQIAGLICRNFTTGHSRKMADLDIQHFLVLHNITAICEVDTRSLVVYIRNKGAMNAIISSEILDVEQLQKMLKQTPSMAGLELSSKVATKEIYYYGDKSASRKVAVLDLGIKKSILENMSRRDMYMKVFPAETRASELLDFSPDGLFISNGPGDPAAMPYAIEAAKELLESGTPLFGICLGNQIMAQAVGISTYKMHNGHRGLNHPVRNLLRNTCEITSQNHGFCVSAEDVQDHPEVKISHINLNDNTVEGLVFKNRPAFCVQYHPEAAPGPHDAEYLFDEFKELMDRHK